MGSTWFPRSTRASNRRQLESLRYKFSRAQAIYTEYRALRELIPPPVKTDEPGQSAAGLKPCATVGTIAAPGAATPAVARAVMSAPLETPTVTPAPLEAPVTPTPAPVRRASRRWIAVAAVIVLASAGSLGISHYKRGGGVSALERAGLDGTAFEGTIQPATTFSIAAPSGLVIRDVRVAVGDRVTAGQPLIVADDRDAAAAREAAVLDVRAADARVDDLARQLAGISRTPAEEMARASAALSAAEQDISQVPTRQWRDSPERAQAAYDQARARLGRLERLSDQGLIARQELEDAQIAVRVAQDDLANARRAAEAGTTLRSARSQKIDVQVQLARAQRAQQQTALQGELNAARVAREQAAQRLQAAEQRIRAATITASSSGVVIDLPAHPGDQVYAGAPLARLAVLDRMIAEVQVAPSLINALRPGAPARVRLPGVPPADAQGTIALVNPIPGRNGNHVVVVRFDNTAGRLLAGQVAEVRFSLP